MKSTGEGKSKSATTKKPNRLISETSPYLLQHAHNPVDWYPWSPEALKRAAAEDKPILLSIGYSACHWCHVMEHESFEDPDIAKFMNESFVCIKVDREERPDIDDIYMKAVQLMTGHGGWPMTVFLTPDLEPFFAGTYFPPADRHGMPGFNRVLASVATAWQNNREQIDNSAGEVTKYLGMFDEAGEGATALEAKPVEMAIDHMLKLFDSDWGGFGNSPKFPFPCSLYLAMRCLTGKSPVTGWKRDQLTDLVTTTLDKMAYGGIHDQLAGGFARYSVDRKWLVPHFEKMLYDNATLSKAYFEGYLLSGRQYWKEVGRDTLEFVLNELRTPEGAFYSSLDADSEGEEGKYYVWKPEEVVAVLGDTDGPWVNEVLGIVAGGNFEHGTSVAHLVDSPEALAKRYGTSDADFWKRLNPLKEKLLAAREKRVRPGRDEKVLTSWNALMVSGFVAGYRTCRDEKYLEAARQATSFILTTLSKDGRLLRTYGQGQAKLNAYLDDYAFLVQALLDLAEVDVDPRWYHEAVRIADKMVEHFWDRKNGAFFYTSDDHEKLITRPKNFYDGSTPSGTSVASMSLLRLARLTGKEAYREKAEETIKIFAPHFAKAPDQFANLIAALDFDLSAPTEIALVADLTKPGWKEMLEEISSVYLPNNVCLLKDTSKELASPLVESRPAVDGKATVYICRNFACDKPITDSGTLATRLKELTRPQ